MTRKSSKSASREWSGPQPAPEAVRTPSLGFGVPRRSASVHVDPWLSGECRIDRAAPAILAGDLIADPGQGQARSALLCFKDARP